MIGKNFFTDIGPCTAVKEFQGELQRLRDAGKPDSAHLEFVFKFEGGPMLVEISITHDPESDTSTALVRKPL